jgi:hypothetical protein
MSGDKEISLKGIARTSSILSDDDVYSLSIIAVINKIVIPCVAIAFVNSNCFYYALFSAPPVTAESLACLNLGTVELCYNILGSQSSDSNITYQPPFIYTYECSSFFLSDYAPVFIYMCAWISLVCPSAWFCFQRFQYYYERTYCLEAMKADLNLARVSSLRPSMLLDSFNDVMTRSSWIFQKSIQVDDHTIEDSDKDAQITKTRNTMDMIHFERMTEDGALWLNTNMTNPHSANMKDGEGKSGDECSRTTPGVVLFPSVFAWYFYQCSCYALPLNWQSYYSLYKPHSDNVSKVPNNIIVSMKHRFILRINNFLAVLLSFGVIFPPLAVIVFCSICILLYFECKNFVRILYFILYYENDLALKQEIDECFGILNQMHGKIVLVIMLLSSWLLGFLLFDTLGDITGYELALLPFLLMVAFVPLFYFSLCYCSRKMSTTPEESQLFEHMDTVSPELENFNPMVEKSFAVMEITDHDDASM